VVFRSQLRIQFPSGRAVELVSSPIEFGFKNRDMQLAVLSPARRFLPRCMLDLLVQIPTNVIDPWLNTSGVIFHYLHISASP
jgi:hypothetical protein